jgi:hypothetical protein
LLAVSLTPPVLSPEHAATLVATIERELLTPHGLRDAPGSTRVEPRWLGPLASARLRLEQRAAGTHAGVHAAFRAMRDTRRRLGGALPEALTLEPRAPFGVIGRQGDPVCIVTAAELLRAWVEDVEHADAVVTVAR